MKPTQTRAAQVMSDQQILSTINRILAREGGFVDDPADRGGATNMGITQPVADEFHAGDVRNLTRVQAVMIYRQLFAAWGILDIPDPATFDLVADCCVNHGAKRGIKWLQHGIGMADAEIDGSIGPHTRSIMASVGTNGVEEWRDVYATILASRIQFYGAIVANDPTQVRFLKGWLGRACEFIR